MSLKTLGKSWEQSRTFFQNIENSLEKSWKLVEKCFLEITAEEQETR